MIVKVRGPLRRFVAFNPEVRVQATTVDGGLRAACAQYPALSNALFDSSGCLRGVHNIALNRTMLHRDELQMPTTEGDVVEVVTALAGG